MDLIRHFQGPKNYPPMIFGNFRPYSSTFNKKINFNKKFERDYTAYPTIYCLWDMGFGLNKAISSVFWFIRLNYYIISWLQLLHSISEFSQFVSDKSQNAAALTEPLHGMGTGDKAVNNNNTHNNNNLNVIYLILLSFCHVNSPF